METKPPSKRRRKQEKEEEDIVSEEEGKIIPFRLIQGGRLGLKTKPPDKNDWLSPMQCGTLFLAGDSRSANPFLQEYEVDDKTDITVKLLTKINNSEVRIWVVPVLFCQNHYLHEVLWPV
jgi:hypothetical protein